MKHKVKFIYLCRRCTARAGVPNTFDSGIVVETAVPLALLELCLRENARLPARDQQPIRIVHQCGELTFGVADLIGVEPI